MGRKKMLVGFFGLLLLAGSTLVQAQDSFVAYLSGANENPPVETSGNGIAIVTLNEAETEIDYLLFVFNLEDVTAAHIHLGVIGQNGPVIHPLGTPSSGASSGNIPVDATSVANLKNGSFYVNVHNTEHPSGVIRGQLFDRPIQFQSVIHASEEVPPVGGSSGTGHALLTLSDDLGTLSWDVRVRNLPNITAAHIHAGARGVAGGVIFPIADAEFSEISGSADIDSDQLVTLLSEGYYVNVHTTARPAGEIRGQIIASPPAPQDRLIATAISAQPVPSLTEWGMILLSLSLLGFGAMAIMKRKTVQA